LINRLNQFRRIPTRCQNQAVNYKDMLASAVPVWLSFENGPWPMGGVLPRLRPTMSWAAATGRVQR
jgi:hypothetical protein